MFHFNMETVLITLLNLKVVFSGINQYYETTSKVYIAVLDCPIYNPPSFLKNIGGHGSKLLLECQEGSRKTLNISCEGGSWPQLSRIDCSLHPDISTVLVHSSQVTSDSSLLILY